MDHIARSVRLHQWCIGFAVILIAMTIAAAGRAQTATNGLIMLIEFEKIEGVRHWESELDQRGLTALIQVQHNVLTEYPKDFERLATKGYPIAGLYAEKPFWDVPYDEQYARMREAKEAVEQITHKPMRLFGSRYFAYDENTLQAADALGIEYVLGRGTAGAWRPSTPRASTRPRSSRYRTFRSRRWAPARSAIIAYGRAARPIRISPRSWTR